MKLKSLWSSIFQVQNTFLIQKSMKPITSDVVSYNNEESDETSEYRRQREKNNESVRKSRAKNRVKLEECANHVRELQQENLKLNKHYEQLQSELVTLKGLFQHLYPIKMKPSEVSTSTLYNIIMSKDFIHNSKMTPQPNPNNNNKEQPNNRQLHNANGPQSSAFSL